MYISSGEALIERYTQLWDRLAGFTFGEYTVVGHVGVLVAGTLLMAAFVGSNAWVRGASKHHISRVIKAAETGRIVLPEHDYQVFKRWEKNPYGF